MLCPCACTLGWVGCRVSRSLYDRLSNRLASNQWELHGATVARFRFDAVTCNGSMTHVLSRDNNGHVSMDTCARQ